MAGSQRGCRAASWRSIPSDGQCVGRAACPTAAAALWSTTPPAPEMARILALSFPNGWDAPPSILNCSVIRCFTDHHPATTCTHSCTFELASVPCSPRLKCMALNPTPTACDTIRDGGIGRQLQRPLLAPRCCTRTACVLAQVPQQSLPLISCSKGHTNLIWLRDRWGSRIRKVVGGGITGTDWHSARRAGAVSGRRQRDLLRAANGAAAPQKRLEPSASCKVAAPPERLLFQQQPLNSRGAAATSVGPLTWAG